jgi:hypothetical protein
MIINLKKTIVSDCNVFCEDYFITKENLDYSKTQSLILPFAEVFFRSNISEAKVLYADLQRGIVGRNVQVELENSLVDWWGTEFHPSEVWWPFEFGGWRRYGSTSVNECLSSIYNPWDECPSSLHGSIPYFREWAYYLVTSQKLREINRYRSNIRYRKFVENPYKDPALKYPHSKLCEEWLEMIGMRTNPVHEAGLDDLYNIRGLKNAKPHIKMGKAIKLQSYRRYVWRQFQSIRQNNRKVFLGHPSEILNILHFLRGNEITPNMYEPPRFAITRWEEIPERDIVPLGRILYPDRISLGMGDRLSIFKAIESVNNKYLLTDARPDKLRYLAQSLENKPIISNTRFIRSCRSYVDLPEWVKLFFGKRKLALIFYASKYKRSPLSMVDLPYSRSLERSLRNPISLIFPNSEKLYWTVIHRALKRPDGEDILDTLHCQEYREESTFISALRAVDKFLSSSTYAPDRPKVEKDEFSDHLLEMTIDNPLIDDILGERTFNDILEEYNADEFYEYEEYYPVFDIDEMDYDVSPSRSSLASLKDPLAYDI